MTKSEYMKMLEIQLGKFSESVRQEILEDYENHFAEAMAQGKTEEEIIEELGDIQDMIDEIPEEDIAEENIAEEFEGEKQEFEGSVKKEYSCGYRKIVADCKAADIILKSSIDNKLYVNYENPDGTESGQSFYQYENDGVFYVGVNKNDATTSTKNVKFDFLGFHLDIPFQKSYEAGQMTIEIPQGFPDIELRTTSGDIDLINVSGEILRVKTTSGDFQSELAEYRQMTISATSGDIDVESVKSDRLELSATSGDITLERVDANELIAVTGSGDIEANEFKGAEVSVKTGSGDIEFNGETHTYNGRSGSGDQELEFSGELNMVNIVAGSGSIELNLNNNGGASITTYTGSGDVGIHADEFTQKGENHYVVGNGRATVTVRTGSGDVDIINKVCTR